jgi:Bacteriophytochrome (light-regulated signal transduction histidine kinase)
MMPVDLESCSREPIHIPGSIQPHGALLVVEREALTALQSSANLAGFGGLEPTGCLGRSLDVTAPSLAKTIRDAIKDPVSRNPVAVELGNASFDVSWTDQDGVLLLEIERSGERRQPAAHYRALQRSFTQMREARSLTDLCDTIARHASSLTGFERVMVYRFDEDWHGEVVAECLTAEVDSYLHHHFPASDIPAQARELYRRSWLRIIPDARYEPVPVHPVENPLTGRPLDMSFVGLRSVSPIHLEYLQNMGVGASMSISLIVRGKLWGLIACHHRTPRPLPYSTRAACELFGQVASIEIDAKRETGELTEQAEATRIQTRFFDIIAREKNVVDALVKYTPDLLSFLGAGGAAIHINGETTLSGSTPDAEGVAALIEWLVSQKMDPVFATDSLREVFPPAAAWTAVASGLLAVRLSRVEPHYVLWFRPEVVTTITWAGDPDKQPREGDRLHPRKSFASWRQTVTGRSLRWTTTERQGARELVLAINALVLRRTERLLRANADLERRNTDLNSFAYIASHDLKEPLRGIANYCEFMREDHGHELNAEALRKLDTMTGLAAYCEDLLTVLNHYSRIGRIELKRMSTNLDSILDEVLRATESLPANEGVEIVRADPLPTVNCDPVLVREVFANLVANAIRYNTSPRKRVTIGCSDPAPEAEIYVQDNGIGIPQKHHDAIFTMFRRLHGRDEFGGGTGAGLAIVRSIVEKHGGSIRVESEPGKGSTFRFTFGR